MSKLMSGLVLLASVIAPLQASAQTWEADSQVFIIQGIIVDSERAAGELGYDQFSLSYTGDPKAKVRWLAIVGADTWNGDSFDAKNALDNIVPPNLILAGKPDVLKVVETAPDNTKLRLEGMLLQGSGNYLLQSAQIVPPKAK